MCFDLLISLHWSFSYITLSELFKFKFHSLSSKILKIPEFNLLNISNIISEWKACNEIIEEAEAYGQWSGGNNNNKDDRLAGGYENVPTVDIHFTQLGFQEAWLYIVKTYAAPMVTKHYTGYYPDSKPNLMFIGIVHFIFLLNNTNTCFLRGSRVGFVVRSYTDMFSPNELHVK